MEENFSASATFSATLEEATMLKTTSIALFFWAGAATLTAHAQGAGLDAAGPPLEHRATGLLNENNLTATGETVPHPGASQGAGTTELDRNIKRKNDQLENSICSNC